MCSKKKRNQLSKGWASPMLSFDSELFAFFFLFSPFLFFLFFFFLYCTQEPIRSSIDISIQSPSERFYVILFFLEQTTQVWSRFESFNLFKTRRERKKEKNLSVCTSNFDTIEMFTNWLPCTLWQFSNWRVRFWSIVAPSYFLFFFFFFLFFLCCWQFFGCPSLSCSRGYSDGHWIKSRFDGHRNTTRREMNVLSDPLYLP